MADELTIITHTYDLLLWTLQHTEKFPRSHRHTLGRRIEDKLLDLFDLLLEAKFRQVPDKDVPISVAELARVWPILQSLATSATGKLISRTCLTSNKAGILRQAGLRLEQLRFLFRLAKDLRILPLNSQGHAIERLQEIGRQLGGWRRKAEGPP